MRHDELVEALSASIPEDDTLIPNKVSFTSLRRLLEKAEESVQSRVEDLEDWVQSKIPESINKKKHVVTQKFDRLKKKVGQVFRSIFPKKYKSYRKGYYKNYRIKGRAGVDQRTFLDGIKPRVLNFFHQQKKSIKVDQILRMQFSRENIKDGTNEFAVKDLHTYMMEVYAGNYNSEDYEKVKENLLEQVDTFLENGSQWVFDSVESYDINVAKFSRFKGRSYVKLPDVLRNKKAFLNIKNYDNKCFAKSITEAIFPRNGKVANRDNAEFARNMLKLKWDGIEFPADPVVASKKFESNNPEYALNVYGYDDTEKEESDKYSIQRVSKKIGDPKVKKIVNLLLYSNGKVSHYVVITNMSLAFRSLVTKYEHASAMCYRCMKACKSIEALEEHLELCNEYEACRIVMPEVDEDGNPPYYEFKNFHKQLMVPIIGCFDFESILKKIQSEILYAWIILKG